MVVMKKTVNGHRLFATDEPGTALGGNLPMRKFLDAAAKGRLTFEYEGTWGLPDRMWRSVKPFTPPPLRTAIELLPQFTFTYLALAAIVLGILYFVFFMGAGPDEEYVPPRPRDPRQTKKVD